MGKQIIISVGREFGSGGHEIAERLARHYNIPLYDKEIFDHIEEKPREKIMHEYIESIADKKERLTLQNMQMLISRELIPEEMAFYAKLFLFNKLLS